MKYKPSRDIPKAVREIKSLSPSKIRDWIREHRTEVDKKSGKRKQVNRTVQSITMWFKDHPDVYEELKREIGEEELPKEAITETLFENGVFRELPCIKNWMMDLVNEGAKKEAINKFINTLKRICKGIVRGRGKKVEYIENWGLKHPRRLTLEDGKLFIYEQGKRDYSTRNARLTLRNFLTSKGIVVKKSDISGKEEEEAGQYADLYVSKSKLHEILEWIKSFNREAWKASDFAYKTGTRIGATLNADASFVNWELMRVTVFEKASRGKKKRRVPKKIPKELWNEIPREGKLFRITREEINNILQTAYKEIIPEIEPRIVRPFHFWRHMFAQHMLRKTKLNYGLVAKLGTWTVGALERYYGKMDLETALEMGKEALESL